MKLYEYIDIPFFTISIVIGFIMVYTMTKNNKRKIVVFPTPENVDYIQYQHENGMCFSPEPVKTKCSVDTKDYSSNIIV